MLTSDGHFLPQPGPSASVVEALDAGHGSKESADGQALLGLDLARRAAAIDRLFRAQSPGLLRFLRRTVRDDEAADLLQEAFLRLTRLFALGSPPARPEAYLQEIAGNLLRDGSRRRRRRSESLHEPLEDQPIADPAPGPADYLEARDMLRAYEASLLKLKPKTREIFLLHRTRGRSYAEIAAEVGLSVSGVEKHMMKAIALIDRELGRSQ